ncbi:transposable element Tcb2 transposase [Trichonephila clavipes]|nr:transposable element Tcb2 transposase [Trichonephila clavipes]
MRGWKQWTYEHRTTRKTSMGRRKVASVRDDRHLSSWPYESCFNLWDHDGRIRVRRYAGERCISECTIKQHSGITPGVMVWGANSYDWYELRQDNARPHVAKAVRDFCSAQHMQLLPWPVYSPDMSLIEHVWDLVGWRLARDPRPEASKDELLLHI